jgi:aspartate racemase
MPNHDLGEIAFTENGPIDIEQFHALHRLVGWDPRRQQTPEKTAEMLRLNHYHIAAHTRSGQLVGFARVCGDPYIAQILDVITHPDYRRRGIATRCMAGVLAYLKGADYISVTLTDGSRLPGFYEQFGFQRLDAVTPTRVWRRGMAIYLGPPAYESPLRQSRPQFQKQAKTIGILGGISHESTIAYYDRILKKYYARQNDYHYPRIIIHSLDFQTFTDYENSGDRAGYIAEIMSGVESLEAAGADVILMAANSPHSVYFEIERRTMLPMISIVAETVRYAQQRHLKILLLLGIKYTMQSDFYQTACREAGIEVITPLETEQDLIERIIFEELVIGLFRAESKQTLLGIINRYNVDGVILGCTELPLIIKPDDLSIEAIDTLDIHAGAALRYSLGVENGY